MAKSKAKKARVLLDASGVSLLHIDVTNSAFRVTGKRCLGSVELAGRSPIKGGSVRVVVYEE